MFRKNRVQGHIISEGRSYKTNLVKSVRLNLRVLFRIYLELQVEFFCYLSWARN
jgi:hypothetical protein